MIESVDTFSYKLRLVIASLLIVAGLLLLPFLLRAVWVSPTAHAKSVSGEMTSKDSSTKESPNAITRGMFSGIDGLAKTTESIEKTVTTTLSSVTKSIVVGSVQTGKAVAHGVGTGAKSTADAVASGVSFTGRTAGSLVGFIASTPGVGEIIRPADANESQLPVIDASSSGLTEGQGGISTTGSDKQEKTTYTNSDPQWPIHGAITTDFGVPHWPYQPVHTGLDISDRRASGITPIHPFRPGVVKETVRSTTGLGNYVEIDHGSGMTSVYGHLSSITVHEGEEVDNNSVLGYEGSTGASTGTHLHFEIRLNGQPVDPHRYISGQP